MANVDYKFWAKYLTEIHKTMGKENDIALELAAGNGSLSKYMRKNFSQLFVSDYSLQMLKSFELKNFNKVCCSMTQMPFKIKFDFIYSTFDSVNYLCEESLLKIFFFESNLLLSNGGLLLFDVSLKNNSLKYVKKLNRKGNYKGIKYVQKSSFDEKTKIHLNEIKMKFQNGETITEIHRQKIYDFYYYFEVIESCNLYVIECFNSFTYKDADENSERVQFIVKRK